MVETACCAATLEVSHFPARILRSRFRNAAIIISEVALTAAAYTISVYALQQFEGDLWVREVLGALPYLLAIRMGCLISFGIFKFPLRYATIGDLLRVGESVGVSTFIFIVVSRLWLRNLHFPAVLYALDGVLIFLLLCTVHFGFRAYQVQKAMHRKIGKRVVILGAGDAGAAVTRELAQDSKSKFIPVAILDDDPLKYRSSICGVPVAGDLASLTRVVREAHADEILICIPSATRGQMQRILASCRECQVPVRTLPSVSELIDGQVSKKDLRSIRIEDLLQRDELPYDAQSVASVVGGKVVLVTGAGGTIGSELSRQIAAANPERLLLLDKSENSLFYTHLEVVERYPNLAVKPLLADISRADLVQRIFQTERPEIVFHAAAHKHVGLLESHPKEAIYNNVLGTRNLVLAAVQAGVQRFVNISTDKAVNPCNYMGLSKRLTEMIVRESSRQGGSTRFMNVRFGNVAGSNGSVLRIFWDQVHKGAPLRVTDPCATRYFMSVSEAVYLIFRAAALGQGGETFILEMGEPINIYDLARTVSLFSGYVPEDELPIEFIGLRKGEKLHEELWDVGENPKPTEQGQILMITEHNEPKISVLDRVHDLEIALARDDMDRLHEVLFELVPAFAYNREQSLASEYEVRSFQDWLPAGPPPQFPPLGPIPISHLDSEPSMPSGGQQVLLGD